MELVSHQTCLFEALQEMINTYLAKHPSLSLNALATRAQVPVSTLRRISIGQTKTEVAPHNVLNLTSYIFREKNLAKLLSLIPKVIAEYLKTTFGHFIFEASQTQESVFSHDLNTYLKDEVSYFIYKLAANHAGATLMDIQELYGRMGETKLKKMITDGLISEIDGRFHAHEKSFSLDVTIAANHLPSLVRFYKPEMMAVGLNQMYSMSESLTQEAINEIKNIQREAVKAIHQIMNTEENYGDIPYFTLNLSETLTIPTSGEVQ